MEAHPKVVELLAALSPNYERLRDPGARERLAGVATLARIAAIGGFNAEDLVQMVRAVVEGKDPRLEVLRSIILSLHRGSSVDEVRERFAKLVRDVTPQEISQLEQSLIEEGLPEEEVKRLCDVHVEVFKESLEKGEAAGVGFLDLDVGSLTPEQVNLVLTHLPVDITFVDENGRVAYYSGGKERIFPRSPGVIGREVSRCHPPQERAHC